MVERQFWMQKSLTSAFWGGKSLFLMVKSTCSMLNSKLSHLFLSLKKQQHLHVCCCKTMSIHIKNHIFCGKSWSTPKNSPVPIRSQGPRVPSATSPPVIPWHCPAAPEAAPLCGAPAHSSRAEWATDSGGRWWCLGQKSSEFPMFVDGWWYSHPSEKYESQLG